MARGKGVNEHKWVAGVALAACALAIAVGIRYAPDPPVPPGPPDASTLPPPPQYPELDRADAKLIADIAAAWGTDRASQNASIVFSGFDQTDKVRDRVVKLLDACGDAAAPPFLAFLRDRFGSRGETTFSITSEKPDDAKEAWAGCWLRTHADSDTRAVLRRMAADGAIEENLRRQCVVALARPGDDAARSTLVGIALDEREPDSVRLHVLRRLPRLGGQAPAALRELLESARPTVPVAAAACLATWGDCEAPSLLVDAMRRSIKADDGATLILCADALRHVIPAGAGLDERLAAATEAGLSWSGGPEGEEQARAARAAMRTELMTDVQAWFDAHPELRETAFERARRAYLEGPRRRDEMALTSLDAIVAAPEEHLDVAAAMLLTRVGPEKGGELLERLHLVANSIRRDVGAGASPERWIEALNAKLLSKSQRGEFPHEPSELSYVMTTGWGDCAGFTSLYLAVAERLALPIYAVEAPHHVFARWDDGVVRRNIECTDGGTAPTDASYATRGDGLAVRDEDVASGRFLTNLTRREFLSLALGDRAETRRVTGRLREARESADAAVRLAPHRAHALIIRAGIAADAGDDATAAVADVRAAQALRRLAAGEALVAAQVFLYAGLADDALRTADAALAMAPGRAALSAVRARALLHLGRIEEARREANAALLRDGADEDAVVADVEIRLVSDDPSWRERLARSVEQPATSPDVHFAFARVLLDGPAGGPSAPADALAVLDAVRGVETSNSTGLRGFLRERTVDGNRRRYWWLRARCCRALGDDAGAASAEAALAKIDAR